MKKRLLTAVLILTSCIVGYSQCPTADAGADQNICETQTQVTMAATTTGATTIAWTTSGTGSFSPDATVEDPVYHPSQADITGGSVTLTITASQVGCPDASDDMKVNISIVPTVVADEDRKECVDVNSIPLNASGTHIETATWTSSGGGTIQNANQLSATYLVQPQDVTNGSVAFTITVTNGSCPNVTDVFTATFTAVPTVDAGPNQNACGKVTTVLNGTVGGSATGGTWTTSGSGTFTPNENTLNATYNPSNADFAAGTVTLTLSTTGGCRTVTDFMTITYIPAPTVNAGPDQTVCGSGSPVALNGAVGGSATGGTWVSTGTGTFTPNANTLNATYTPSAADLANGSVLLTLTATGGCANVSDKMNIAFSNPHTANAGPDQSICASNVVTINATATATIAWTSSGSGTFTPNATSEDVTYTASAADIASGSVTLTITSSGGDCPSVSDAMVLTISTVCISGISSSNEKANLIKIYPNPASDYAQIEIPAELSVTEFSVFDALGEKVWSAGVSNSIIKFDLNNLNKGVYYFTFTDNSGNRLSRKFIKQ